MGCLGDAEADICCYDECFVEKSEILINGEINKENLLLSITKGGSVSEEEQIVVKKSMVTCEDKLKRMAKQKTCKIGDNIFNFVQCVLTQNYLNCPNVTENEECKSLGTVLSKCKPITTPRTTTTSTTRRTTRTLPTTPETLKTSNSSTAKASRGHPQKVSNSSLAVTNVTVKPELNQNLSTKIPTQTDKKP
jgi:hypothetical protein